MTFRHACLALAALSLMGSTTWARKTIPFRELNGNTLQAQRQNYLLQQAQRMCLLCERTPTVRAHLNLSVFNVQEMRVIVYGNRYYNSKRDLILRDKGKLRMLEKKYPPTDQAHPQHSPVDQLEKFLGKQRFQRLQQLDWQSLIRGRAGYNYSYILLNDPNFISMTGLTPEQRKKFYEKTRGDSRQIERLYKEVATQVRQPGADLDKLKAKIQKAIKDLDAPIKDVFNKDQQRRLNAICGPHLPGAPWAEEGFAGFMTHHGSTAKIKMVFEQMIHQLEAKKKAAVKVGK